MKDKEQIEWQKRQMKRNKAKENKSTYEAFVLLRYNRNGTSELTIQLPCPMTINEAFRWMEHEWDKLPGFNFKSMY